MTYYVKGHEKPKHVQSNVTMITVQNSLLYRDD